MQRQHRQSNEIKFRTSLNNPKTMVARTIESGHLTKGGAEAHALRLLNMEPMCDILMEVLHNGDWLTYATRPAGYKSRWNRDADTERIVFGVERSSMSKPVVLDDDPPTDYDWDIL